MKYKDLIDKLLPFADEEINITASSGEMGPTTISTVRFYHHGKNGKFFAGVRQEYDTFTFDNVGEATIITTE